MVIQPFHTGSGSERKSIVGCTTFGTLMESTELVPHLSPAQKVYSENRVYHSLGFMRRTCCDRLAADPGCHGAVGPLVDRIIEVETDVPVREGLVHRLVFQRPPQPLDTFGDHSRR